MSSREEAERKMLRIFVAVAAALSVAIFVLAFVPGIEVLGCRPCGTGRVQPASQQPLGVLTFLLSTLAPGIVVWRSGKIYTALVWAMLSTATSVMGFLIAFQLHDLQTHAMKLWPSIVFDQLILALMFLVIAALPAACGVFWLVTRRRTPRPVFPRARVVRR